MSLRLSTSRRRAHRFRQGVVGGHDKEKVISEEMDDFKLGHLERQRQQQHVESAALEFGEQLLGLCLQEIKAQIGILQVQLRQHVRQDIRGQRGNHAKAQRTAQHVGSMLSQVCQVAHCTEDRSGALRDLDAKIGEHRSAPAPLDQLDTERFFQLAHLHRKRGLTDSASLRGSSEVLVTSKCIKIMKLPDRNHADKLRLTWRQGNFIGFFAPNGSRVTLSQLGNAW
jgi:hypothetical protein